MASHTNGVAFARFRATGIAFVVLAAGAGVSVAIAADSGVSTLAGNGLEGGAGDGAAATLARLHSPADVAMLPDGGFLIADTKNQRIRKVAPNGTITTVAGTGDPGFNGDGGPAEDAELDSPGGVAVLPGGGFLIADTQNDRIREVAADGDIDTVVGGSSGPGSGLLDKPQSVAALPGGDILIADTGSHVIRRMSSGIVTVAAGTGSEGYSGDDGLATLAMLDAPHDVVALPGGGFLFSDHDRNVVRKVDSLGTITTVAGGGGSAAEGIPATSAALDGPAGLAALAAGRFLVVVEHDHALRSVSGSGVIETIAGSGAQGFADDPAEPLGAKFDSPLGVDADQPGNIIFVADQENDRVRAVRAGSGRPLPGAQTPAETPAQRKADKTTPDPVLGKAVSLSTTKGTIRIRRPGRKGFVILGAAKRVPVGSVIDARRGTVALSSALNTKGRTQTAEFWAGVFEVRQTRSGRGMTDIILRGAKPRCPAAAGKAGMSKAKRKRPRGRRLWAKDDRGRFRTRGGNSVATTRGTLWLTEERCSGTVTKVFKGAVVVRNRHTGKKVTVRAGKRYLARRKR